MVTTTDVVTTAEDGTVTLGIDRPQQIKPQQNLSNRNRANRNKINQIAAITQTSKTLKPLKRTTRINNSNRTKLKPHNNQTAEIIKPQKNSNHNSWSNCSRKRQKGRYLSDLSFIPLKEKCQNTATNIPQTTKNTRSNHSNFNSNLSEEHEYNDQTVGKNLSKNTSNFTKITTK